MCNGVLKQFGVETTLHDPTIGAGIAQLMRPNTRLIFTESPGSLMFEIQDIPAIAAAAHARDALRRKRQLFQVRDRGKAQGAGAGAFCEQEPR